MVSKHILALWEFMATDVNEVVSLLQKLTTDVSGFIARQDQLEASQEQSSKMQEEALGELKDVLNEVVYGGRRPERGKSLAATEGEIYSPHDMTFDFGEIMTPNASATGRSVTQSIPPPASVQVQHPSVTQNPQTSLNMASMAQIS